MLITVLLNDAWTLQRAKGTFFLSFLRPGAFLGSGAPSAPAAAATASLAGAPSLAGAAAPALASAFLAALAAFSGFAPASFATSSLGSFASAMILLGLSPLTHPFLPAGAFFLPATVLRGPLRVRAFVCVLWPRTGRLRRCRMPL